MPHDAYAWKHQQIRAQLLAELRAIGVAACPLCHLAMTADMNLHLHHTDPAAKLAGLPGDTLAHARCNMADGGRRNGHAKRETVTAGAGLAPGQRKAKPPGHQCDAAQCDYRPAGTSRCW
jgi:hypothetical protein